MIHLASLVFAVLAAGVILTALAVVAFPNMFHSALALVATLSLVAAFFALLGADFLAASQILVYVGGIMIIMLFVVMFSQQPLDALQRQVNDQWLPGLLLSLVVCAALVRSVSKFTSEQVGFTALTPTSDSIGHLLLGEMVLPFEVISLVLLAALVGAVLFGQDKQENPENPPK